MRLACKCMTMECPRCGFSQPKDRYCANCGLDVETYVVQPPSAFSRMAQNSNLHLTLIVALIVLVVGYIFYSQRELVSREVNELFADSPLSSQEAGAPNADTEAAVPAAAPAQTRAAPPEPVPAAKLEITGNINTMAPPAETRKPSERVEVSSWEIPRETLSSLLATAEKVGESNGGRAYLWSDGTKTIESIQAAGHRLSLSRTMPLAIGSQTMIESPTTANESFQYGFYTQVTGSEDGLISIKWDATMVLPPMEAPAEVAAPPPAGGVPVNARPLTEMTLNGRIDLRDKALLLVVFEPANRSPRADIIVRAGEGPWTVLLSEAFRSGASDWAVLLELK